MPSPKGHHDIYIMKVGNEYRVRPAVWSYNGQANSSVRFRNLTNEPVLLGLPAGVVFDSNDRSHHLDGQANLLTSVWELKLKKKDIGASETYRYAVIVDTPEGFVAAAGESEPIIIIDPPPA
jgi:hypothetical protein